MDKKHIDLADLLSVRFSYSPDADMLAFTDWAEQRLSENEVNENVLILASLGLDKAISQYEVYRYFDAYLLDNAIAHPSPFELQTMIVRYALKRIAFSASEAEVWSGLTHFKDFDYEVGPSRILKNIVSYLTDTYEDFVNYYDEDEGYFYLRRPRHELIVKESQAKYVQESAMRFLRLFEGEYYRLGM